MEGKESVKCPTSSRMYAKKSSGNERKREEATSGNENEKEALDAHLPLYSSKPDTKRTPPQFPELSKRTSRRSSQTCAAGVVRMGSNSKNWRTYPTDDLPKQEPRKLSENEERRAHNEEPHRLELVQDCENDVGHHSEID